MDLFEKFALVCLMTPLGDPKDKVTHWGVPFNAIGQSGAAKSARLGQITKALGLSCFPIYSSNKSPEHFGGVPVAGPGGFSVECILPQVTQAMDVRKAAIFLDEISTAPEAVQAALLSFINERQVGEYVLPPGVRIVLAMNPPDVAANGQDLTIPMVNRMAHIPYSPPTNKQWAKYMYSRAPGGLPPADLPKFKDAEEQIKKGWAKHYMEVLSITCGFLDDNAGSYVSKFLNAANQEEVREGRKLQDQPEPDDIRASKPWPSTRTWQFSVDAVTASRCLGMEGAFEVELVSRLVGEGLATEWISYMTKENLPKSADALDGKWAIPKRLDIVRAVIGSAALFVTEQEVIQEKHRRAIQCWQLLRKCMDKGYSDIVVQSIRILCNANLDMDCPNEGVQDAAEDVCNELNENGMLEYALKT